MYEFLKEKCDCLRKILFGEDESLSAWPKPMLYAASDVLSPDGLPCEYRNASYDAVYSGTEGGYRKFRKVMEKAFSSKNHALPLSELWEMMRRGDSTPSSDAALRGWNMRIQESEESNAEFMLVNDGERNMRVTYDPRVSGISFSNKMRNTLENVAYSFGWSDPIIAGKHVSPGGGGFDVANTMYPNIRFIGSEENYIEFFRQNRSLRKESDSVGKEKIEFFLKNLQHSLKEVHISPVVSIEDVPKEIFLENPLRLPWLMRSDVDSSMDGNMNAQFLEIVQGALDNERKDCLYSKNSREKMNDLGSGMRGYMEKIYPLSKEQDVGLSIMKANKKYYFPNECYERALVDESNPDEYIQKFFTYFPEQPEILVLERDSQGNACYRATPCGGGGEEQGSESKKLYGDDAAAAAECLDPLLVRFNFPGGREREFKFLSSSISVSLRDGIFSGGSGEVDKMSGNYRGMYILDIESRKVANFLNRAFTENTNDCVTWQLKKSNEGYGKTRAITPEGVNFIARVLQSFPSLYGVIDGARLPKNPSEFNDPRDALKAERGEKKTFRGVLCQAGGDGKYYLRLPGENLRTGPIRETEPKCSEHPGTKLGRSGRYVDATLRGGGVVSVKPAAGYTR